MRNVSMVISATRFFSCRARRAAILAMVAVLPTPVGPTKTETRLPRPLGLGKAKYLAICSRTLVSSSFLPPEPGPRCSLNLETISGLSSAMRKRSAHLAVSPPLRELFSSVALIWLSSALISISSLFRNSSDISFSGRRSAAAVTSTRGGLNKPKKPGSRMGRELTITASGPNSLRKRCSATCISLATTFLILILHLPHPKFLC